MDLNYYLEREQVERVRADTAGHEAAADAHRNLANLYRQQIEQYRQASRAETAPRTGA